MTGKETHLRISEVTVSAVPEDNINHDLFSVTVSWRGGDQYAVARHRRCLDAQGIWDYEPLPSNRTDEWIATHRFPYDEAIRLARQACQLLTVNGLTVDELRDVLAGGDA